MQQPLGITGQLIGLQVHGVPDSKVPQGRCLPGVGDDSESERRSIC